MSRVTTKQLLLAGAHFGHLTKRWNPKMNRYIFTKKKGIHIIDLKKTVNCLEKVCDELMRIVSNRGKVLFVGTKSQAKDILKQEAARCGAYFVTERWLGGFLTNYQTVRKSIKTLDDLEKKKTDGTYEKISKKEQISIEKKSAKLNSVLEGVRNMKILPDAVFIVDIEKEKIALQEAKKLGIPVFAIVDTNVDPDLVDFPIPANDDAFKSVGLIAKIVSDAILEASQVAKIKLQDDHAEARSNDEKEAPKKRKKLPRKPVKKSETEQKDNNQTEGVENGNIS